MTVRICKLNRAFDMHMWLCDDCQKDKKQDGYTVEPKDVVSPGFACDVCGRGAAKVPERKAKGAE